MKNSLRRPFQVPEELPKQGEQKEVNVPVLRDGILYLGDKPWNEIEELKLFIREENQKLIEAIKGKP